MERVSTLLSRFQFGEAGQAVHDLLWDDFCDWYIEAAKIRLAGSDEPAAARAAHTLKTVLITGLKLLHPYMPFVTEALWGHLHPDGSAGALITARWPEPEPGDLRRSAAAKNVNAVQAAIRAIRRTRADFRIDPGTQISAEIVPGAAEAQVRAEAPVIKRLARISDLQISAAQPTAPEPSAGSIMRRHDRRCAFIVAAGIAVYLPLEELVDFEAERKRARSQADVSEASVKRLAGLLAKPGFVGKAPADLVEQRRQQLADARADLAQVKPIHHRIGSLILPMAEPAAIPAFQISLFERLFASIAQEMGITLQRSSFSPNIKEPTRFFLRGVLTARAGSPRRPNTFRCTWERCRCRSPRRWSSLSAIPPPPATW